MSMKEETISVRLRPVSPHLGIYKKQISSVMSIFHRLTGLGLFVGISGVTWWFILWILSKFDPIYVGLFDCVYTKVALFGLSFCFFFHFSTGIRHLVWDTGRCFSIKAINVTGLVAVISALVLTIWFWFGIIT